MAENTEFVLPSPPGSPPPEEVIPAVLPSPPASPPPEEVIPAVLPSPPASPPPEKVIPAVVESHDHTRLEDGTSYPSELVEDFQQQILSEFKVTSNPVIWSDVIGQKQVKDRLLELIILPLRFPHLFARVRKVSWHACNRLLLYGVHGSGKTLLVKALANEISPECTMFHIPSHCLMSRFDNCSATMKFQRLFQTARAHRPAVILIDGMEEFCNPESAHVITSLINLLDYGQDNYTDVVVILSCLDPNKLEPLLRRIFEHRLYIEMPDIQERAEILKKNLNGDNAWELTAEDFMEIAVKTEGWTGSDLVALCTSAAMCPVRELAGNHGDSYFRLVPRSALRCPPDDVKDSGDIYVKCEHTDPGAEKISLFDLTPDNLYLRSVSIEDLRRERVKIWPTSCKDEIQKLDYFHKNFGPAGYSKISNKKEPVVESLMKLTRCSVRSLLQPMFQTHEASSSIAQKYDIVDQLPIPRSLKIFLMLET